YAVSQRIHAMVEQQYACWREQLSPALTAHGLRILNVRDLDPSDLSWAEKYYQSQVRPVLTPLAIDPAHPFPQLLNKSLNIIVQLDFTQNKQTSRRLAVVQVPRVLPRLVKLPRKDSSQHYVFLANLIGQRLQDLFPGTKIIGHWQFRITRNGELYID